MHTAADILPLPVNVGWSILLTLGFWAVGRLVRVDGSDGGGVGAGAGCTGPLIAIRRCDEWGTVVVHAGVVCGRYNSGYFAGNFLLRDEALPLKAGPARGYGSGNGVRRGQRESWGLQPAELRTLRSLKTPALIQKFIDGLTYQYADTAGSPRRVLRERRGHCLEGALLAAAALRVNGRPPLVMDLESVRDDDHVVALYRERGLWGGIAKSNYAGLRFRSPVYRTLRELALSYFEHYYNLRGERTLRAYSVAVDLSRLDAKHWMTDEEEVWSVPELLIAARHYPIVPDKVARSLPRMDRRSFEAGMHGTVKH